jgi:hypothetical protein
VPGLLAGGHRGAVDLREDARELAEAVRQRVALHDLGAHAQHDALHARLLGLLRDREQRLLQRQTGAHQGGQLAGEQRQVGGGDLAREAEGLLARGLLLGHFRDRDRQQLLLAQQLADVARRVALEDAGALAAAGLKGCVFEGAQLPSPRA